MPETEASAASWTDDLALLRDAAAEAGAIASRYFGKNPEVWMKGGKSPVSEADVAVDRFLKATLTSARPSYGWLSEEAEEKPGDFGPEPFFVVDPIDGTRAFLDGRSTWCVSIAVVLDGRPVAGVLDCPQKGEVFEARLAGGARLNGEALLVGPVEPPPLIAGPDTMLDVLPDPLKSSVRRHRYVPSLAYRVAMVAATRIAATYVRPNAHDWDLAAADLVLQEAGGAIRTASGSTPFYGAPGARHGALVAGSGALLDTLQQHIGKPAG